MATETAFNWAEVVDYARRFDTTPPKTQYELAGITLEDHLGVPVAVVPLWHEVVTARLKIPKNDAKALRRAQERLQRALGEIEAIYPLNPSGIFIQVAYGLPYFTDYLPANLTAEYMPRAIQDGDTREWALIDSIKFPKDPEALVLEHNDISFHFKSDYNDHIHNVMHALFYPGTYFLNGIPSENVYVGDLFNITSIRRGFAGRGMPRIMARRLRIPGADKIPDGAMLFMGFTSSHVHGLAQGNLPSFETIPGYTDQTPDSYFAHGTMMHLSHIALDLEGWYGLDAKDRLYRMFNPRRTEEPEVLSPSQAPETSTFKKQLEEDARKTKILGHNAQMQFLSRVEKDTTTVYGEKIPKGTVLFLRQDFDTVENPFGFDSNGRVNPEPKPGVHFIGFAPSAQLFEKIRKEMDGVELQKKYGLADADTGFTKFLVTTHRQNYLEPPRSHRAFPLAELI
ncbi:MAG TPA: hypothetical protein VFY05_02680 [Candidatus Angelobacter sp.]|nr:hypothetical protein [Candidatus Angelobacter sp.]